MKCLFVVVLLSVFTSCKTTTEPSGKQHSYEKQLHPCRSTGTCR